MKKLTLFICFLTMPYAQAGMVDFIKRLCRQRLCRRGAAKPLDLDRDGLALDMQRYVTTHEGHAGSPFAHSIYLARVMVQWLDENSKWTEGIDRSDRHALLVAAVLHDIGKCGDGKLLFEKKPDHPEVGFRMLLGEQRYYIDEHRIINIKKWLDAEPGLSETHRAFIKVLVGIHWDFGPVVDGKESYTNYLAKLQVLAQKAGYNNGIVDDRLVRAAILIGAADVKAIQPCEYPVPELKKYQIKPIRSGWDCWTTWEYPTKGLAVRETLLAQFARRHESMLDLGPTPPSTSAAAALPAPGSY